MSDQHEGKGSCLCGKIRIFASTVSKSISGCHCQMCRKWGGGPFLVADCGNDVSFENQESITIFGSSQWLERGFCSQCGTHLFCRLKETKQYFIPVGIFEQPKDFVFERQIFIDEKPAYYGFANETENMTEAEFIAQFPRPTA
ncbi:GFA family protein [Nostoc sp. FACHB-280]|uniref:GFA family protein n=1 Tax=Nostoc sp. FACHB-280 TaxID=2692839 RepID=UPI00168AC83F|nr:GFA family protein [Nostoc sp. FACHB-280]MBD2492921.1 GFA family protein [Nostoc sp. FACHB-280]